MNRPVLFTAQREEKKEEEGPDSKLGNAGRFWVFLGPEKITVPALGWACFSRPGRQGCSGSTA